MKKVAIIGLGAMGILFGAQIAQKIGDALSDAGKPFMRQDIEAKRPSEVALFSGTVVALGQKHGIKTPVNAMLYDNIMAIEKSYRGY
nr:ketopantoate reductase C-terminal domain-containing protein [Acetobacterium bakii]